MSTRSARAILRGPVAVDEREDERERVRGQAAEEGVERVARQGREGEIDLHGRPERAGHAAEAHEPDCGRGDDEEQREIDGARPAKRSSSALAAPNHPQDPAAHSPLRRHSRPRVCGVKLT